MEMSYRCIHKNLLIFCYSWQRAYFIPCGVHHATSPTSSIPLIVVEGRGRDVSLPYLVNQVGRAVSQRSGGFSQDGIQTWFHFCRCYKEGNTEYLTGPLWSPSEFDILRAGCQDSKGRIWIEMNMKWQSFSSGLASVSAMSESSRNSLNASKLLPSYISGNSTSKSGNIQWEPQTSIFKEGSKLGNSE